MESDEKQKNYFKYLIDEYPVKQRFKNILKQIQDVIEALGISEFVTVDTDLLGQAILDYFEDIDKLKKFEGIKKVNVDKIYSYETFWLLKRKPIQVISNSSKKNLIFVNEKIFTFIFIVKILAELGISRETKNTRLLSFFELIYYNFKFREYTQKSLETVVSSFFCGYSFSWVKWGAMSESKMTFEEIKSNKEKFLKAYGLEKLFKTCENTWDELLAIGEDYEKKRNGEYLQIIQNYLTEI